MNDEQRITELVDKVEECWRRLRMEPPVRRWLVAELEAELSAALVAGTPAGELAPTDVVTFAVERARAREAELEGWDEALSPGAVIITAVTAGFAGVSVSWLVVLTDPVGQAIYSPLGPVDPLLALVLAGLLVVGTMAVALTVLFARFGRPLRSALAATALAATGGAVGLALAVGYGRSTSYSSDSRTILVEVFLVALGVALASAAGARISPPARSRQ